MGHSVVVDTADSHCTGLNHTGSRGVNQKTGHSGDRVNKEFKTEAQNEKKITKLYSP